MYAEQIQLSKANGTVINPATEEKQDTLINTDFATQTTLAAVLAKITADPATQTTLAAVLAKLSADPATQTTAAAILAKISADPATESGNLQELADTVGAADAAIPSKGLAILVKHRSTDGHTDDEEGDADFLSVDDFDALRVADQRAIDIDNCNATTDWSALNNDTINIAVSANHVFGTGALTFDKTNGAANTIYGCIQKTITEMNVAEIFEAGGFVGLSMYLSSLTNVVGVFIRLGTDASNYNSWFWPVDALTAASWMNLRTAAAQPNYARSAGNGWNPASIKYVAVGVEFSGETNTLSGIVVDHLHLVKGRVTSTDINTATTTSVSTPNINLLRVSNSPTGVAGAGNVGAGTQRVTIATDDVNQALIKTYTGKQADALMNYKPADEDYSSAGTVYRGYIDKDGNWFIIKEVITSTAKSVRFCKGTTDYETATTGAWATRASQTYDYFHNIF